MPAAAVIPAPIAYIKVVAVKKLVVGFRGSLCNSHAVDTCLLLWGGVFLGQPEDTTRRQGKGHCGRGPFIFLEDVTGP